MMWPKLPFEYTKYKKIPDFRVKTDKLIKDFLNLKAKKMKFV